MSLLCCLSLYFLFSQNKSSKKDRDCFEERERKLGHEHRPTVFQLMVIDMLAGVIVLNVIMCT